MLQPNKKAKAIRIKIIGAPANVQNAKFPFSDAIRNQITSSVNVSSRIAF